MSPAGDAVFGYRTGGKDSTGGAPPIPWEGAELYDFAFSELPPVTSGGYVRSIAEFSFRRGGRLRKRAPRPYVNLNIGSLEHDEKFRERDWLRDRFGRFLKYIGPQSPPWKKGKNGKEEANFQVAKVFPSVDSDDAIGYGRHMVNLGDGRALIEVAEQIESLGRNPHPSPEQIAALKAGGRPIVAANGAAYTVVDPKQLEIVSDPDTKAGGRARLSSNPNEAQALGANDPEDMVPDQGVSELVPEDAKALEDLLRQRARRIGEDEERTALEEAADYIGGALQSGDIDEQDAALDAAEDVLRRAAMRKGISDRDRDEFLEHARAVDDLLPKEPDQEAEDAAKRAAEAARYRPYQEPEQGPGRAKAMKKADLDAIDGEKGLVQQQQRKLLGAQRNRENLLAQQRNDIIRDAARAHRRGVLRPVQADAIDGIAKGIEDGRIDLPEDAAPRLRALAKALREPSAPGDDDALVREGTGLFRQVKDAEAQRVLGNALNGLANEPGEERRNELRKAVRNAGNRDPQVRPAARALLDKLGPEPDAGPDRGLEPPKRRATLPEAVTPEAEAPTPTPEAPTPTPEAEAPTPEAREAFPPGGVLEEQAAREASRREAAKAINVEGRERELRQAEEQLELLESRVPMVERDAVSPEVLQRYMDGIEDQRAEVERRRAAVEEAKAAPVPTETPQEALQRLEREADSAEARAANAAERARRKERQPGRDYRGLDAMEAAITRDEAEKARKLADEARAEYEAAQRGEEPRATLEEVPEAAPEEEPAGARPEVPPLADAPHGATTVDLPNATNNDSPVVMMDGRPIALVDIGGVKVPFYVSTGKGGKEGVATGRWYPFFGLSSNDGDLPSWFNKVLGQEDYYHNPVLRDVAEHLDRQYGDLRTADLPEIAKSDPEYADFERALNEGLPGDAADMAAPREVNRQVEANREGIDRQLRDRFPDAFEGAAPSYKIAKIQASLDEAEARYQEAKADPDFDPDELEDLRLDAEGYRAYLQEEMDRLHPVEEQPVEEQPVEEQPVELRDAPEVWEEGALERAYDALEGAGYELDDEALAAAEAVESAESPAEKYDALNAYADRLDRMAQSRTMSPESRDDFEEASADLRRAADEHLRDMEEAGPEAAPESSEVPGATDAERMAQETQGAERRPSGEYESTGTAPNGRERWEAEDGYAIERIPPEESGAGGPNWAARNRDDEVVGEFETPAGAEAAIDKERSLDEQEAAEAAEVERDRVRDEFFEAEDVPAAGFVETDPSQPGRRRWEAEDGYAIEKAAPGEVERGGNEWLAFDPTGEFLGDHGAVGGAEDAINEERALDELFEQRGGPTTADFERAAEELGVAPISNDDLVAEGWDPYPEPQVGSRSPDGRYSHIETEYGYSEVMDLETGDIYHSAGEKFTREELDRIMAGEAEPAWPRDEEGITGPESGDAAVDALRRRLQGEEPLPGDEEAIEAARRERVSEETLRERGWSVEEDPLVEYGWLAYSPDGRYSLAQDGEGNQQLFIHDEMTDDWREIERPGNGSEYTSSELSELTGDSEREIPDTPRRPAYPYDINNLVEDGWEFEDDPQVEGARIGYSPDGRFAIVEGDDGSQQLFEKDPATGDWRDMAPPADGYQYNNEEMWDLVENRAPAETDLGDPFDDPAAVNELDEALLDGGPNSEIPEVVDAVDALDSVTTDDGRVDPGAASDDLAGAAEKLDDASVAIDDKGDGTDGARDLQGALDDAADSMDEAADTAAAKEQASGTAPERIPLPTSPPNTGNLQNLFRTDEVDIARAGRKNDRAHVRYNQANRDYRNAMRDGDEEGAAEAARRMQQALSDLAAELNATGDEDEAAAARKLQALSRKIGRDLRRAGFDRTKFDRRNQPKARERRKAAAARRRERERNAAARKQQRERERAKRRRASAAKRRQKKQGERKGGQRKGGLQRTPNIEQGLDEAGSALFDVGLGDEPGWRDRMDEVRNARTRDELADALMEAANYLDVTADESSGEDRDRLLNAAGDLAEWAAEVQGKGQGYRYPADGDELDEIVERLDNNLGVMRPDHNRDGLPLTDEQRHALARMFQATEDDDQFANLIQGGWMDEIADDAIAWMNGEDNWIADELGRYQGGPRTARPVEPIYEPQQPGAPEVEAPESIRPEYRRPESGPAIVPSTTPETGGPKQGRKDIVVPDDWDRVWPGSELEPGDRVIAEYDDEGNLVDLEVPEGFDLGADELEALEDAMGLYRPEVPAAPRQPIDWGTGEPDAEREQRILDEFTSREKEWFRPEGEDSVPPESQNVQAELADAYGQVADIPGSDAVGDAVDRYAGAETPEERAQAVVDAVRSMESLEPESGGDADRADAVADAIKRVLDNPDAAAFFDEPDRDAAPDEVDAREAQLDALDGVAADVGQGSLDDAFEGFVRDLEDMFQFAIQGGHRGVNAKDGERPGDTDDELRALFEKARNPRAKGARKSLINKVGGKEGWALDMATQAVDPDARRRFLDYAERMGALRRRLSEEFEGVGGVQGEKHRLAAQRKWDKVKELFGEEPRGEGAAAPGTGGPGAPVIHAVPGWHYMDDYSDDVDYRPYRQDLQNIANRLEQMRSDGPWRKQHEADASLLDNAYKDLKALLDNLGRGSDARREEALERLINNLNRGDFDHPMGPQLLDVMRDELIQIRRDAHGDNVPASEWDLSDEDIEGVRNAIRRFAGRGNEYGRAFNNMQGALEDALEAEAGSPERWAALMRARNALDLAHARGAEPIMRKMRVRVDPDRLASAGDPRFILAGENYAPNRPSPRGRPLTPDELAFLDLGADWVAQQGEGVRRDQARRLANQLEAARNSYNAGEYGKFEAFYDMAISSAVAGGFWDIAGRLTQIRASRQGAQDPARIDSLANSPEVAALVRALPLKRPRDPRKKSDQTRRRENARGMIQEALAPGANPEFSRVLLSSALWQLRQANHPGDARLRDLLSEFDPNADVRPRVPQVPGADPNGVPPGLRNRPNPAPNMGRANELDVLDGFIRDAREGGPGFVQPGEVAERLNIPEERAKEILDRMADRNILERKDDGAFMLGEAAAAMLDRGGNAELRRVARQVLARGDLGEEILPAQRFGEEQSLEQEVAGLSGNEQFRIGDRVFDRLQELAARAAKAREENDLLGYAKALEELRYGADAYGLNLPGVQRAYGEVIGNRGADRADRARAHLEMAAKRIDAMFGDNDIADRVDDAVSRMRAGDLVGAEAQLEAARRDLADRYGIGREPNGEAAADPGAPDVAQEARQLYMDLAKLQADLDPARLDGVAGSFVSFLGKDIVPDRDGRHPGVNDAADALVEAVQVGDRQDFERAVSGLFRELTKAGYHGRADRLESQAAKVINAFFDPGKREVVESELWQLPSDIKPDIADLVGRERFADADVLLRDAAGRAIGEGDLSRLADIRRVRDSLLDAFDQLGPMRYGYDGQDLGKRLADVARLRQLPFLPVRNEALEDAYRKVGEAARRAAEGELDPAKRRNLMDAAAQADQRASEFRRAMEIEEPDSRLRRVLTGEQVAARPRYPSPGFVPVKGNEEYGLLPGDVGRDHYGDLVRVVRNVLPGQEDERFPEPGLWGINLSNGRAIRVHGAGLELLNPDNPLVAAPNPLPYQLRKYSPELGAGDFADYGTHDAGRIAAMLDAAPSAVDVLRGDGPYARVELDELLRAAGGGNNAELDQQSFQGEAGRVGGRVQIRPNGLGADDPPRAEFDLDIFEGPDGFPGIRVRNFSGDPDAVTAVIDNLRLWGIGNKARGIEMDIDGAIGPRMARLGADWDVEAMGGVDNVRDAIRQMVRNAAGRQGDLTDTQREDLAALLQQANDADSAADLPTPVELAYAGFDGEDFDPSLADDMFADVPWQGRVGLAADDRAAVANRAMRALAEPSVVPLAGNGQLSPAGQELFAALRYKGDTIPGWTGRRIGNGALSDPWLYTNDATGERFIIKDPEETFGDASQVEAEELASDALRAMGVVDMPVAKADIDREMAIMQFAGQGDPEVVGDPETVYNFGGFTDHVMDQLVNPDDLIRMSIFDLLVGNHDRHDNNWMIAPAEGGKYKLFPIDHNFALPNFEDPSDIAEEERLDEAFEGGTFSHHYYVGERMAIYARSLMRQGLTPREIRDRMRDLAIRAIDGLLMDGNLTADQKVRTRRLLSRAQQHSPEVLADYLFKLGGGRI